MRPSGGAERCVSVTAHADPSARSLDHPHWGGESRPQSGRSPEVDPALQVLSHADGNPNVATALKPKWTGVPLRDCPTQQPPFPHSPGIPPAHRAAVPLPSHTRLEVVANMDKSMPKSHDNSWPTCDLQIIILSLEGNIRVAILANYSPSQLLIPQPRFLSPLFSGNIFKHVVLMPFKHVVLMPWCVEIHAMCAAISKMQILSQCAEDGFGLSKDFSRVRVVPNQKARTSQIFWSTSRTFEENPTGWPSRLRFQQPTGVLIGTPALLAGGLRKQATLLPLRRQGQAQMMPSIPSAPGQD